MSEASKWMPFAANYDEKIFSVTSFAHHRERLLSAAKSGYILNLGCGPTPHLNRALVDARNFVVATDFCLAMITESQRTYRHPRLGHLVADNRRLGLANDAFDTVISVNSILPEQRADVVKMFAEAYRVLQSGGRFVAILVAFDCSLEGIARGFEFLVDKENCRDYDTTGWQCRHTPATLARELGAAGATTFSRERLYNDSPQERAALEGLYGITLRDFRPYEYLVVVHKP